MRASLLLVALLVAAACAAPDGEACAFASQQPRFWQATTRLSALHVSPSGSFFLGDALLRTLQRQLGLAQCQVVLTAGETCGAAFAALPCADPVYVCAGELTISDSIYQAAKSGLCGSSAPAPAPAALAGPPAPASPPAPPPAVCETLAAYPAIQEHVAADECVAVCYAQLQPAAAGASGVQLAPPPPPAAAGACYTFQLVVDAATQPDVANAAADLHNMTTAGALLDSLSSFAAPGSGLNFIISDSGRAWGCGGDGSRVVCLSLAVAACPAPRCGQRAAAASCALWQLPHRLPSCRDHHRRGLWVLPAAQPAALASPAQPLAAPAFSAAALATAAALPLLARQRHRPRQRRRPLCVCPVDAQRGAAGLRRVGPLLR